MCSATCRASSSNGQKQRTALAALAGPRARRAAARRSAAQRRRQAALRDAPRAAAAAAELRLDRALRDPGLQGGDGAGRPHRACCVDGRFEQVATAGAIYGAPGSVEIARLFGDPTINLCPAVRQRRPKVRGRDARHPPVALAGGLAACRRIATACSACGRRTSRSSTRAGGRRLARRARRGDADQRARRALSARPRTARSCWRPAPRTTRPFGRGHRQVWARIAASAPCLFDRENGARIAPPRPERSHHGDAWLSTR